MANFVLLYNGGGTPETEAEQAAVMQAWGAWMGALGENLVDGGNPIVPAAKHIAADGTVSDAASGQASGYSVISAESMAAAVEMAAACPIRDAGGSISVFETFEM